MVPVLYTGGGKLRLVKRRDLIEGCRLYERGRHPHGKPEYAYMPHYYSCPVLRRERAEWVKTNKRGV